MAEALEQVIKRVGKREAMRMVLERPQAILDNVSPDRTKPVLGLLNKPPETDSVSIWRHPISKIRTFFS
jgi:hypothetical protein